MDLQQLRIMFEITQQERQELIELLEFDFKRFSVPFTYKGRAFGETIYECEVRGWFDRSDAIDRFVDENFKIKNI